MLCYDHHPFIDYDCNHYSQVNFLFEPLVVIENGSFMNAVKNRGIDERIGRFHTNGRHDHE
jgi:hypothetical protein